MQEEQDQNPQANLPKPDTELPTKSLEGEKTPSNQTESDNQEEDTSKIKQEPYNIIINVPEKKDKAATTANFISLVNVLVAATLAVFTYLLFTKTRDSTDAAINASKIADSSFQISKENIRFSDSVTKENIVIAQRSVAIAESTFKINQASFMRMDSNTKKSLEISIRSLRTQIENEEVARKSMEFEYRSDLTLKSAKITQFAADKPIEGIAEFTTIGRSPVTVDSQFTATTFANVAISSAKFVLNPFNELFNKLPKLRPIDKQYYSEVTSYTTLITNPPYIDKDVFVMGVKGELLIVYTGKIVYENPINGRKRYYLFAVSIPPIAPVSTDPNFKPFTKIYEKNGDAN